MAEQKNSMPPRRPGGPGHGPRSHGYQRPQDLRGTVKKLLHYVGRYKGLLVLVAICLLLSSVGSVASSYFLKPAINDYILPGDFAGPCVRICSISCRGSPCATSTPTSPATS